MKYRLNIDTFMNNIAYPVMFILMLDLPMFIAFWNWLGE